MGKVEELKLGGALGKLSKSSRFTLIKTF